MFVPVDFRRSVPLSLISLSAASFLFCLVAGCDPAPPKPTFPPGASIASPTSRKSVDSKSPLPPVAEPTSTPSKFLPPPSKLEIKWTETSSLVPPSKEVALVVSEPIVNSSDPRAVAFATGIARWLEFHVGGQPALNRTPLWTSVERVRLELKLSDFRLKESDLPDAGKRIGATHFLLSEVSGDAKNLSISFYLAQTADQKIVGKPIVMSGNPEALLAKLPEIAKELSSRMAVKTSIPPTKISLNFDEMELMGRIPRQPDSSLPKAEREKLFSISEREPLAALLALAALNEEDHTNVDALGKRLVIGSGENAASFGALQQLQVNQILIFEKELDRSLAKYPNNFALLGAKTMIARIRRSPEELELADKVSLAFPKNPEAWLTSAYSYSEQMSHLRKGRTSEKISSREWNTLDRYSDAWESRAKKATEIDPNYAKAWARLASSATFAGDYATANHAMDRAFEIDPLNEDAIAWALQMYQHKWGGDPAKLLKAANATPEAYKFSAETFQAVEALKANGMIAEADSLAKRVVERQEEIFVQNPNSYLAAYNHAYGLMKVGRSRPALKAFKNILAQFPDKSQAQYHYAEALSDQFRFKEAIPILEKYIKKFPNYDEALSALGYAYKSDSQPEKAIPLFIRAIENGAEGNIPTMLGDCYFNAKRFKEAEQAYIKALKANPSDEFAARNCCWAYVADKNPAKAVEYGEYALNLKRDDMVAMKYIGYAYYMDHQYEKSEEAYRRVLQEAPNDWNSHGNLGNTLIELHKKEEARKEWDLVARQIPTTPDAKEAREMLAKYP